MKKWLLYIMLVGVLGIHTTSCITDDDPAPYCPQEGKTQVVFTLALNNNGSRAITNLNRGETYDNEDGVGVDNLINNLQVLFFGNDEDGNYIGKVQNAIFYEQSTGVYEFIGEISIDAGYVTTNTDGTLSLNAKMMVLANCADITLDANSTYANVQTLAYDGATSPSQIPMWGIQAINTPITVGARNELSDIDLLRAMAKVEVIMAAEDYTMENIILNSYNTKGYCAPELDESTWAAVGATADLATERCANYNTTVTGADLTVAATDNKKVVFYIPECANSTDNPLSMYVNIKKGTTDVDLNLTDANLYFKDYSDNAPFNIVRNHIYRYTITAVKTGFDLKLTVAPWTEVTENFNYEDNLSYENGSWNNATRTNNVVSLMTSSTADATNVTAVYNFNVNTPQTIEWMAVLEDPEGKFQFDMSQTSGKGTVEGEDAIQRTVRGELLVTGSNLNLGVKAIDPSESGQYEAILRVYVTYGGKTIELDLTDGEQTELNHFTIQHSKL